MIRLSVITDEVSQDLDVAIDFAKRHGLEGVELRSVWDGSIFDATDADVRRMHGKLQDANLAVCCLGLPFFKCDLEDTSARSAHIDKLKRTLEHANLLGASCVRGFAFWEKPDAPVPYGRIVDAFAPVLPLLRDAGVRMALESDPSVNTATATRLAQLLSALDSPWMRAVWDGGNLLFRPDGESPALGYALVRPWLAHVHVKDAVHIPEGAQAVCVGTGHSDVPGQLAWLAADGYDGWISLETHYRLNRAIGEALLRVPMGSAFSMDGLEASEESMIQLIHLMKEAGIR